MGNGASIAIEAKKVGNDAFVKKDFSRAIEAYTRSIEDDDTDPKLFTNRAAAYIGAGCHGFAYYDAERSIKLDRTWHKGYYRKGQALLALGVPDLAVISLKLCVALVPGDSASRELLQEAESKVAEKRALRGYLVSWGSDEHSALGHSSARRHSSSQHGISVPRPVEALKSHRFIDVACGMGHCVSVCLDGYVYAWGMNSTAQCADAQHDGKVGAQVITSPTVLPSLFSVRVVAVACGAGHTVVVTDKGKAFSWGLGANGQLGLSETELTIIQKPKQIPTSSEIVLTGVACGFAHTMLVDHRGKLFSCGWNSQGQAGIIEPSLNRLTNNGNIVPVLVLVPGFDEGIQHVACGGVHTMVVCKSKEIGSHALWCCGANTCGQLGLGTFGDAAKFEMVPHIGSSVALASCGEEYSFAVTAQREVMAWGLNNVGQLGLPVTKPEDPTSTQNHILRPTLVDALTGAGVEWIVSGQGLSYAVTLEGAVWAWGAVEHHGGDLQLPAPSRFLGQHEILSIAAGRRHFCAHCRSPAAHDAELVRKSAGCSLRAGRTIEFEAILHTPRGEVWTQHVAGQPFAAFAIDEEKGHSGGVVEVSDNMDGTLTIFFKPWDAGTFCLHCVLAGKHIIGSPHLLEVEAGAICPEKCFCTLPLLRRIRCGDELTFYITAKDMHENFVSGGRQRASAILTSGDPPANYVVEDEQNGQSRLSLRWDTTGRRCIAATIAEGDAHPDLLKKSNVEVVPALPSPAHFVLEGLSTSDGKLSIEAGSLCTCALLIRDRFGNETAEMLHDLQIHLEGPQISVPVTWKPPLEQAPLFTERFGVVLDPWQPPQSDHCRISVSFEASIAGDFELVWSSKSADSSGRALLAVCCGEADGSQSIVIGTESRIFHPDSSGKMLVQFGVVAHDSFGNRCDMEDIDNIEMTFRHKVQDSSEEQKLSLISEGSGSFAAGGFVDSLGEWVLSVFIHGSTVAGSPFSVHVEEDPTEVRRRGEEDRRQKILLEQQRRQQDKDAAEARIRRLAEERASADAERKRKQDVDDAEHARRQELNEDEKELEKRRKIYERIRREEEVRKRAEEVLRKEVEERRNKMKKEKEKKEKRCGGGFVVTFRDRNDAG